MGKKQGRGITTDSRMNMAGIKRSLHIRPARKPTIIKAAATAAATALAAIVTVTATRCAQTPQYPQALLCADSIAAKSPAEAASMLRGLESEMGKADEAVRMRYKLVRLKLTAYLFGAYKSDSMALALVGYYESRGDRRLLPEAYYYAGKAYMSLNDSPNAINYFHKVLDTAPQADLNLRSRTYSQLGYIFDRQWLDADALAMFKQAYRYDSLANDTVSMVFTLRDIGGMHTDMNQPDSASICYERALRLAMESRDKQMTVSVMGQLARFYNQQNSYDSAMAYLRRISSLECDQDRSSIVGITASWYEANGKLDSAIIYYKELAETGTIYTKADAYGKLAEHYLANNDLAKAKECLATYKQLTDSIQAITATETINQKHDLYEYRFREREIHRLQLKNKEKAIIISILTSICTITLLTLAFAVKYKRQKRDTQKIKLEKYQLEKGMLQGNTEETASKEELMRNEEICKSINIMLNDPHSKKRITEEDWARLALAVNKIYPGFDQKLYALCKMSESDYRVCLLIKIKITPSGIATMVSLSTPGVSTLRSKLYKRAFGKKGHPADWDDVIASL